MTDDKLTWHPAGIYRGVFEGFVIQANRHISESGQTAWHTVSFNNSGDFAHRSYWVVDGQFRKTLKQTLGPNEITTGDVIEYVADLERQAIL